MDGLFLVPYTNQKIVWFNVTMYKVSGVKILNSANLFQENGVG